MKTRLLILVRGLYIGGAELVIGNICRNLNRDLFDVSICYLMLNGPVGEELSAAGFHVFKLPRFGFRYGRYFSFIKLCRVIKQIGIDVVHTHDTAALVDASQCRIMLPRIKLVHTFHFGNYPYARRNSLILERLFWRAPDQLVAVGYEQKAMIQQTFNIPRNRVLTIWNGVENKTAATDCPILSRVAEEGNLIIGSLSTLIEQKGITHLLDVARHLKNRVNGFVFVIVGDGPLRPILEAKCRRHNLENVVHFLGWVEHADSRVLPLFDIFFQPSLWEAMSMVLLEAMAAGKPIVASNVGETRHVIDHGKSGFLTEPGNVVNMVDALEKLIKQPRLRTSFGVSAARRYQQYFTAKNMAIQYEKLYHALLS